MFAQYKDFLDLVFVGVLLSLVVVFVIRGLVNDHFKGSLIEDDPEPEAEIIVLDDYRNKKSDIDKKYIFIDKKWNLQRNNV